MTTIIAGTEVRAIIEGVHVPRATADLPQTAAEALYTITGKVLVAQIVGEVTTAIQNQLNNTKLTFNPTGVGASTDLCAVLSIANDAVGTYYSITGTAATAMTDGLWMLDADEVLARPLILGPGTVDLDCAANNTGQVAWELVYVPLSDDGSVAAA